MSPRDALDVSLHDAELNEELQLTTQVMIAASETGEDGPPLNQEQIDELLGLPDSSNNWVSPA